MMPRSASAFPLLRALCAVLGALCLLAGPRQASGQRDAGPSPDGGPVIFEPTPADQAPQVTAAVERGLAQLGAPFTLFVTAKARPGTTVALPEPLVLGAFEVRRKLASVTSHGDASKTFEWQLELVAWEVGDLAVPAIPLVVSGLGATTLHPTAPAPVRILSALAEDDDGKTLRGLAPPRRLLGSRSLGPFTASAAALLALAVALWWWRRRRRRRGAAAPAARPRWMGARETAFDRALRRVADLERSGVLLAEQKTGYAALVDVIRDVLAELSGVTTRDLTSSELVRAMTAHPEVAAAAPTVIGWLALVDRVKYDDYTAGAEEAQRALDGARLVVGALEHIATGGASAVTVRTPDVQEGAA